MLDRAIWITWYDLVAERRDAYLDWLHGSYIPRLLGKPGFLWAAHYATDREFYKGGMQGRMRHTEDAAVPTGNEYILLIGAEDAHAFAHPIPRKLHAGLPQEERALLALRRGARGRRVSSRLVSLLHFGLFAIATAALGAPDFPTKPVRLVVAGAVGSGTDIMARQIGSKLTEAWGQPVVIDPRMGASGLIGAELVAKSAADGYTLWMATMSQLISTTLFQRLPIAKDFAPVSLVATTPYVIAVNASVPVTSIAELIAYSKAKPGQLMYGSAGQGTNMHLCMEMLRTMAGVDLYHVPYKGTTPALNDLIGGQVHAICASAPTLQPFVKGGRLRTLGVTTRVRTMLAPDLPPIAESLPGFELVGWYGVLAPLGTPKEIVSHINAAVVRALKTPETHERLAAQGAEVAGYGPAEFGDFLRKETLRWSKVLRDANIRAAE